MHYKSLLDTRNDLITQTFYCQKQLQSEAVAASVDQKPSHGPPSNLLPFWQCSPHCSVIGTTFPALLKTLSDTEREEMKTKIENTTTQLCSAPKRWQSYPREKERADRRSFQPFFLFFFFFLNHFFPSTGNYRRSSHSSAFERETLPKKTLGYA